MDKLKLEIQRLSYAKDLPLPGYMTDGASGMDLYAAVDEVVSIKPGEFRLIPAGIKIVLPRGYEGQIRPRSGLAVKKGISIINTPGTIDSDYRGEIKVALINLGTDIFKVNRGERIAQMVVQKCPRVELFEVEETPETERNEKGFGHTG